MQVADVVIVGAGATGLALGATLKRHGITAVILDRDDQVGGTWARRYERLHLHTVRSFSGLPYQPIPASQPRYVPTQAYADYLAGYARGQGLDVRLGMPVSSVTRAGRKWQTHIGSTELDMVVESEVVAIATGRHNVPRMPAWPGQDDFRGRVMHSHEYRSGRGFAGRRALVIGIGNSGAEIATDLVEHGATVEIAVRTPPPITSREIAGIPVQLLGMFFKPFPAPFVDWLGRGLRRIGTGDLTSYGLPAERWGPFVSRRPPVIDVGFLKLLKSRQITVRPDVARFTPTGVVFADGTHSDADLVVAATGYGTGLPGILDVPGALDERGYPVSESPLPGLYFAGFVESPRGQLYESARSAHRMARAIARQMSQPADHA